MHQLIRALLGGWPDEGDGDQAFCTAEVHLCAWHSIGPSGVYRVSELHILANGDSNMQTVSTLVEHRHATYLGTFLKRYLGNLFLSAVTTVVGCRDSR